MQIYTIEHSLKNITARFPMLCNLPCLIYILVHDTKAEISISCDV